MEDLVTQIRQNIEIVSEAIEKAAQSVDRDGSQVRLVVVTKAQPVEVIQAVVAAGARCLGENYPEESLPKIQAVSEPVEWHMIGHLQSRKSALVVQHFDAIQSLDSLKLAERLNRQMIELKPGARLPVLLECNVSGEASKFGWDANEEARWEDLLPQFEQIEQLPGLAWQGLMTMPPLFDQPDKVRPFFVRLRKLRDFLQKRFPQLALTELSMGTSGDFQTAVQEGATLVRVGQAIVGPRLHKGDS
jgi:PLP dependent protein